MAVARPIEAIDGRVARSIRARTQVVDAMLDLLEAGELRPPAVKIAARAGVSVRSVFQHFTDLEELFEAAAERQTERIAQLAIPIPAQGSLPTRITNFVGQRAAFLEKITPVRRAAILMEPFSAVIARRLRSERNFSRREIERLFAGEIAGHPPAARKQLIAALTAVTAWPMWESLRTDLGLSRTQALTAMRTAVQALLARR